MRGGITRALHDARDRLVVTDPGLNRLHTATKAVFAVATTIGLEAVLATTTGQTPVVGVLLGAVVALLGSMSIADTTRTGKTWTLLFLPIGPALTMSAAALAHAYPTVEIAGYIVVMIVAVWIRRFGLRYFTYGMLAWIGFFFAMFLQITPAQLPAVLLTLLLAIGWLMVVELLLFPPRPYQMLHRMQQAFELRLRQAAGEAVQQLADPEHADRERLRRSLTRANEAAVLIDGQLAVPRAVTTAEQAEQLRQALLDAEVAVGNLGRVIEGLSGGEDNLTDDLRQGGVRMLDHMQSQRWQEAHRESGEILERLSERRRTGAEAAGVGERQGAGEQQGAELLLFRLAQSVDDINDAVRRWKQTLREVEGPAAGGRTRVAARFAGGSEQTATRQSEFTPAVDLFAGNLPGSAPTVRGMLENRTSSGLSGLTDRISLTTRQSIQVGVAATLAILVGQAVSSQRYYWAAIACFLVFTGTATASEALIKAVQRVLGTLFGIMAAIVLVHFTGDSLFVVLPIVFVSIFLGFYLLRVSYALTIFFITTVLAELYNLIGSFSDGLMVLRLVETAIGGAVGVVIALVLLPANTRYASGYARAVLLQQLSTLLRHLSRQLRDGEQQPLHGDARVLDGQLHQLLLVSRPLTRPAISEFARTTRRQLTMLTSCVHDARSLAAVAASTTGLERETALQVAHCADLLVGMCADLEQPGRERNQHKTHGGQLLTAKSTLVRTVMSLDAPSTGPTEGARRLLHRMRRINNALSTLGTELGMELDESPFDDDTGSQGNSAAAAPGLTS